MNLFGRDIIVFCEQDKAEAHMALLYDLLNGRVLPLAQRIVEAPLHYAIVFPNPKELAPPNIRNSLQTVILKGEMTGDAGKTELMLVSPSVSSAYQVHVLVKDMRKLASITLNDKFSGYVKQMPWGPMNDVWWAVEYNELIRKLQLLQDQVLVVARTEYDRFKNNAILKTLERAGRDLAAQKAFLLSGDLPWEFTYREKDNPTGGYWSPEHRTGPEWPLGDDGIPTPGSIAAAAERERIRAEKAAAEAKIAAEKAGGGDSPSPATSSTPAPTI